MPLNLLEKSSISNRIIEFNDKIRIKEAKSSKELDKVFYIRWKIYLSEGYIDVNDFLNHKLTDDYDKGAFNLLAFENNAPIGTVRFILPSEMDLPTKKAFNILDLNIPKNKIGEVSKLCIEDRYRGTLAGRIIILRFLAEMYKFGKKNNIDYWLVGMTYSLRDYFEKANFGLSFKKLKIGALKPENIEARKTAKKYFERFKITPFLMNIRNVKL